MGISNSPLSMYAYFSHVSAHFHKHNLSETNSSVLSSPPMPRGRSRKVGLRRQDAAMDAMRELGFDREKVRKTLKKLLQVYDGDAGWIFIEEASYKLLIETLLEDADEGENCCSSKDGYAATTSRQMQDDYAATTSGQMQDDYAATISGKMQDDHTGTTSCAPSDVHSLAATPPPADLPAPPALPPPTAAPSPLSTASLYAAVSSPTAELAAANDEVVGLFKRVHMLYHCGPSDIKSHRGSISLAIDVVRTPETLDHHPKKRRRRFHGWINESPEDLLDLRGLILPKKLEQRIERRGKRKSRWDVRPEDM